MRAVTNCTFSAKTSQISVRTGRFRHFMTIHADAIGYPVPGPLIDFVTGVALAILERCMLQRPEKVLRIRPVGIMTFRALRGLSSGVRLGIGLVAETAEFGLSVVESMEVWIVTECAVFVFENRMRICRRNRFRYLIVAV